ncbi:16S rRNA (cytidine(1402)-2'-O)-methyltransferase [Vaginisenegalia massiliensis]|uniref:16S rRNA (cytidine(1402)-2'-O)-methyltransferase n=1 Tax=Vaginisenegalia massiliensis TaxID=2058294 RepID=UPI000F5364B2|nr:16S rRNA (cytidine(1402)-2'-O)-methyltransferase [Vaginisenegalia massiliensis]
MQQQKSYQPDQTIGALYLVPTPIGNLDDMTYRAVKVLASVDLILAEDTRNSIKLLNHFDIHQPMKSFHEFSRPSDLDYYASLLEAGQQIALISDAGMPLINDPGHPLVQRALAMNLPVIALPGANAALTALVASGLDCRQFTYYGFFPRATKEQKQLLSLVGQRQETAIFYESPFRVKKSVQAIQKELGPQTNLVLARELTKRYEEYLRATAAELLTHLADHELKGECVLLIEGGQGGRSEAEIDDTLTDASDLTWKQQVEALMAAQGLDAKEAIKHVAKQQQVKKQLVYQAYHELD